MVTTADNSGQTTNAGRLKHTPNTMTMTTGYQDAGYAKALAEFGRPRELPRSGGWILTRQIPGLLDYDGMGCYPLFACRDWSQLNRDLRLLGDELVCLSIVTDPFGNYEPADLKQWFGKVVIPFKQHFILDLRRSPDRTISEHHRRNARKAFQVVTVEQSNMPIDWLAEWVDLYNTLVTRHNIKGIPVFSRRSFAQQMEVPGLTAFRAMQNETVVGMLLWYTQGEVGYYHLGAYSELGYRLRASFALFRVAIDYFAANGLRWLNLGAGVGTSSDGSDGLSRFKRGWATDTRPAYFCGRIFNRTRYEEIVRLKNAVGTNYFPAYRQGEFG